MCVVMFGTGYCDAPSYLHLTSKKKQGKFEIAQILTTVHTHCRLRISSTVAEYIGRYIHKHAEKQNNNEYMQLI